VYLLAEVLHHQLPLPCFLRVVKLCLPNHRLCLLMLALAPLAAGANLISALTIGSAPVNAPNIEGGYYTDQITGVALDTQGNIFIAGQTFSPTFPKSTPIVPGIPGPAGFMFVARLSPDASKFVYVRLFAKGMRRRFESTRPAMHT
jgi:hypothetical protein